jgi:2-succinyl-5-enolpyruvyl-6-hydroxy-3-cyclohexene-1-carboxylate synthase
VSTSGAVATAVVEAMRRGGVTDVVLSPGSRSAPLAFAVLDADAAGDLRLHVRIDERTAGFLALGLAKGSHRPVALVTTSGSAVAHLHPAVLEAMHVGERVIVISADRPAFLRGTGANQTTYQVGIFGPRVPCGDVAPGETQTAVAAIDAAVGRFGPSHVNLQFAEPLVPAEGAASEEVVPGTVAGSAQRQHGSVPAAHDTPPAETLPAGPLTVLVAGDGAGPPARLLAESANWPLLAEPTSGARTGSNAVRTYRLLLAGERLAGRIERAVVAGHPTLSRSVTRLISRSDIEVISVPGPGGVGTDPGRVARHLDSLPAVNEPADPGWLAEWRRLDEQLSTEVDDLVKHGGADALPLAVAAEVAAAVPPGGLLFAGSSSPVRDLDVMATPYPAGQRRLIIGNRGLSGIDGSVSTALGAALGRRSPRAIGYLGDLTFLHDANGLVTGPDEPRPDLTLVVANDDGGAIFAALEQGGARFAASFERIFGTPHGVSLRELCASTGTAHECIQHPEQLRHRLTEQPAGVRVLEVPVSRAGRRDLGASLDELGRRFG